ncbi:hypothetical protein LDENG_00051300 [Lucifuga dentata]|nr:hypothetical protein LDENG_00051300 [Lucifuga dentata]
MRDVNDSGFVASEDVGRDERLAQVEISLLGVIFFSAAFLNTALLRVLWRQRKQMSRMRVFVLHLCLADLVVAFFQVCPQLMWDITDRFIGPDLVCRLVKYLQVLGMFLSTYVIVVMTVDRYQAVCNPMVKFQRKHARLNIPVCVAWGISLLGSMPQIFIFSRVKVAPDVTFTILMLLGSLNSCANPCIYLLFSGQLPKRLMSLLCQRQAEGKEYLQEEATVVSTL